MKKFKKYIADVSSLVNSYSRKWYAEVSMCIVHANSCAKIITKGLCDITLYNNDRESFYVNLSRPKS